MGVNGIYGLSGSGLDVESMVKVGMMSKQSQYDKMKQQYTKNEWKKADFLNLYDKMNTFYTSTITQYKMSNNMDAHSAESSNSSIKVTASSSAPVMRHTVEVGEAATTAYLIGTNQLTRLGSASQTSAQLKDVLFSDLTSGGSTVTFTENGSRVTKSKTDVAFSFAVGDGTNNSGITSTNPNAVQAKVADVSGATSGAYTVDVSQLASNVAVSGSAASMKRYDDSGNLMEGSTSSQLKNLLFKNLTISGGQVQTYENVTGQSNYDNANDTYKTFTTADSAVRFTIGDGTTNTATINVSYKKIADGYTLGDLADDINSQATANGLNISASYDSETQKFSITNTKTGSASNVSITTGSNNVGTGSYRGSTTAALLNGLGLNDGTSTLSFANNTTTTSASGTDAQLTVNGNAVTSSTNEYTQDGITFKLKDTGVSTVNINKEAIEKNTISVTYDDLLNGYSFNDLASDVNNMNLNTRATYDAVNDKFAFYNKETGKANTIEITVSDADKGGTMAAKFLNDLGLKQSANGELSENAFTFATGESTVAAGTNAEVKIDGVNYDLSNNKSTVNGVTYDFTNATKGSTAVVTVDQDTDKIVDYVKGFIKDYNELLSSLYKAYDEKPNSNYKPLTDAQRDQMTEEQIEKWEAKAKAGMLYHDRTLGKVIDDIRSAITTKIEGVSGSYNSIFSIGISTTGLRGQLVLDEDKLKSALNNDSESVYNVFAKLEYNTDATSAAGKLQQAEDNFAKSGIAQRLSDVLNTGLKSVKSVSGSNSSISEDSDINNLMRELQTKMSNFKAMMNAFENKLYKKYDAMETMLASLGIQLNYVTSAFA